MKIVRLAMLAGVIAMLQTSCMSLDMIAHAEGKPPPTDPNGRPYDPMPGYYALVPLVLPLDLITLPVQYFYFQSGRAEADESQAQF
jgi:hypothetical protein